MAMVKPSLVILAMWVVLVAAAGEKPENLSPVLMQSPEEAPAPNGDCWSVIYNMVDCILFLGVGSNETEPSKLCCSGLKLVLNSTDAQCICEGLKSSVALGIAIDMDKATSLPSTCGISDPSFTISDCDADPPTANPPPTTALAPVAPQVMNVAPAPSTIKSAGAHAIAYSSAVIFSLTMLVSLIF